MRIARTLVAVSATLIIAGVAQAQGMAMGAGKPGGESPMMERCQAMMTERQQDMEHMKTMDARLEQKREAMRAARTDKEKIEAMAAVLDELVGQRAEMRQRMTAMMPRMMEHMGEHMSAGMMGAKKGEVMCPMMQTKSATPEAAKKPADEHAGYH